MTVTELIREIFDEPDFKSIGTCSDFTLERILDTLSMRIVERESDYIVLEVLNRAANYFELQTKGAQGNALTVQLSVDEQTELTFSSKKDFVTLKELPESLDSMFSDIAQYMDSSLTTS